MKPLPLTVFESIAFIAWLAAFGAYGFLFHSSIHAIEVQITPLQILAEFLIPQKKPAPEYPTAGAVVGVRVYSDRGKRIGPVFSSVEKAQDYLDRSRL